MTIAQKGQQALELAQNGWHVFPLMENAKDPKTQHGFKDATTDKERICGWWERFPDANIGIATGKVSGLFVVDIDHKNGVDGDKAADELRLGEHSTYTVSTPNGSHLYFRYPGRDFGCLVGIKPGLDIRANGGYVVAPGSIIDDAEYQVVLNERLQDLPDNLLKLCTSQSKTSQPNTAASKGSVQIQAGSRNATLASFAGILRNAGASQTQIEATLFVKNEEECQPPLSNEEVNRIAKSIARYDTGQLPEKSSLSNIKVVNALQFIDLDLPPRKNLLSPWLPEQGLCMVHSPRGVGKTFFAMGVAHAVSIGSVFLGFEAPESRRVLYIDGEMPAATMQERMRQLMLVNGPSDRFELITPDLQSRDQPSLNLGGEETQQALQPLIENVALIVIDNIATLVRGGNSNEAESWLPVQAWALRQRSEGRSVLFIHHSGKSGQQRGTSSREDVLDTVIKLKRPADYLPDQGAVFEIHFEKNRGFTGDLAKPLEAKLQPDSHGGLAWAHKSLEISTYERCRDLTKEGYSPKEITIELGINKSTVSRHLRSAREINEL